MYKHLINENPFAQKALSKITSEGVDIVKVAHRLGHANPKITLETYALLILNQDNEVADIFQSALDRSVSKYKNESKELMGWFLV